MRVQLVLHNHRGSQIIGNKDIKGSASPSTNVFSSDSQDNTCCQDSFMLTYCQRRGSAVAIKWYIMLATDVSI